MNDIRNCPGLTYLRDLLTRGIASTGATQIVVHDGVDRDTYCTSETGIAKAAEYAAEVDCSVYYQLGKGESRMTLKVVYDGPYDADNADEIINDTNMAAEALFA